MPSDRLTVGFLGRIPPPLGGGGMEVQMQRTGAALESLGHRVSSVDAGEPDDHFDVLHAFGSEPAVGHHLRHWTRNPAPLVVTSVVVVSPGRQERALRLSARVPGVLTSTRMRAEVLRRADAVVAGSEYERGLLTRGFGVAPGRVSVIGNGADPQPDEDVLPEGTPGGDYALMVGAVSRRKGQEEVLRALGGRPRAVVAGAYAGPPSQLAAWERLVRETNSVWLGPVADPRQLGALQRSALAFVHLSSAEVQSLAVLEALARGTPTVLSDIPSHRELAAAHPSLVRIVADASELPGALEQLPSGRPRKPALVPTWREVAERLTAVYRRVAG